MALPIGERIRARRKARGLTQRALRDRLAAHPALAEMDATSISKWETGAASPRPETMAILARELDCTVGHLYGEEPEA